MATKQLEATLLQSDLTAVLYKTLVVLDGPDASITRHVRAEIPGSPVALALLSERDESGRIPGHPYTKWQGAHWVLAALVDIGYPPGDEGLRPLLEQVYAWLFGESHRGKIRAIDGRVRRCASQEGNALFAALSLGLADERADRLAADLIGWQWPDGGWNCDKNPSADTSSFMESLIPLRALALHARTTGDEASRAAAERAAEVFLSRELFKRRSDGAIIDANFVKLHYPCYWHYDILFGLKVMAEAGFIGDPRCAAALDLLESKRLPGGGFPAEARYYRVGGSQPSGRSSVDWGGTGVRRVNPWVTADALFVLTAVGRGTTK
jgi:hypothetical protein